MQNIATCKAPSNERGKNGGCSVRTSDGGLIVVGKGKEREISHQKKTQKLKEFIAMRVARKKRLKELMEKRAGTFF